jgi:hypothetical protein
MFPTPLPIGWVIAFTAAGAIVYWCRWGPNALRVYGLSRIIDLLDVSDRTKRILELSAFVVLGCFIGIGVLQPTNPTQALTAGFAWTGLFGKLKKPA